jgi:hypothetical protein
MIECAVPEKQMPGPDNNEFKQRARLMEKSVKRLPWGTCENSRKPPFTIFNNPFLMTG